MLLLRRAAAAVLLAAVATVLLAPAASAHPMPYSVVALDVHESSISARLELPVEDLRLASGIAVDREASVAAHSEELAGYLREHTRPATLDGRRWAVEVGQLGLSDTEQTAAGPYRELVAQVTMTPPAGADVRRFVLDYDAIVHQVVTHTVLVVVENDWSAGMVDSGAREVGTIHVDTATGDIAPLTVDLASGSAWNGFVGMLQLGMTHILEGTDHLLFLLTLLILAPLLALGGRWRSPAGPGRSARRIVRITVAFTVGHSVTLAISALTRLDIPAWPVEAAIAASILVSAAHAIRPLFPGREAIVAGAFGLVHGMAFSFVLADLHLATGQLVLSLFGFNIGIELMQLAVVALVLPPLVVLSRTRAYAPLRIGIATVAGGCAVGWLLARVGVENPIASLADGLGALGVWAAAALWLAALGTLVARRRSAPPPSPPDVNAPALRR